MGYVVLLVFGAWLLYAWDRTKRSKALMRARSLQREIESTESPIPIPPVLSPTTLSEDGPIKTNRAKALYRDYLIKYGRMIGRPLSRREVSDALEEFSDSVDLHRERLTEEVQFLVEDGRAKVDDLSNRVSALQAQIAELPRGSCRRREFDDELELLREMLKDERSDAALEVAGAKAVLAAFRKDKREFLIDAINTRFHGNDWRNL